MLTIKPAGAVPKFRAVKSAQSNPGKALGIDTWQNLIYRSRAEPDGAQTGRRSP